MFITQDLVWLPKEVGHNMTILFIYLFGSRKFLNTLIMLYICYKTKNAPIHLRSNARLGVVVGSC